MVKKLPDGTVTVMPDLIAIGPAAIAFLEIHDGLDFMLPARADNSSAVL